MEHFTPTRHVSIGDVTARRVRESRPNAAKTFQCLVRPAADRSEAFTGERAGELHSGVYRHTYINSGSDRPSTYPGHPLGLLPFLYFGWALGNSKFPLWGPFNGHFLFYWFQPRTWVPPGTFTESGGLGRTQVHQTPVTNALRGRPGPLLYPLWIGGGN